MAGVILVIGHGEKERARMKIRKPGQRRGGAGVQLTPFLFGASKTEYGEIVKERLRAAAPGSIISTGFLGPADMASIFAQTRLNVHPPLYDAFGMTIVEAACQGAYPPCLHFPPSHPRKPSGPTEPGPGPTKRGPCSIKSGPTANEENGFNKTGEGWNAEEEVDSFRSGMPCFRFLKKERRRKTWSHRNANNRPYKLLKPNSQDGF